jgi:hypothetical protein
VLINKHYSDKFKRVRWAGHVAGMGERKCIQGFGEETLWDEKCGKPKRR